MYDNNKALLEPSRMRPVINGLLEILSALTVPDLGLLDTLLSLCGHHFP